MMPATVAPYTCRAPPNGGVVILRDLGQATAGVDVGFGVAVGAVEGEAVGLGVGEDAGWAHARGRNSPRSNKTEITISRHCFTFILILLH